MPCIGIDGIVSVDADFHKGHATVRFDKTSTGRDEIADAIEATGYKVTN